MGIEVAIMGMALAKGASDISNANKQADAMAAEGSLKAKQIAREGVAKAGQQKMSFLSSGLELQGTAMSVVRSTLDTTQKDVDLLKSNYDKKIKSSLSAARTKALFDFGTTAMTAGAGGGAGTFGGGGMFSQTAAQSNATWNSLGITPMGGA